MNSSALLLIALLARTPAAPAPPGTPAAPATPPVPAAEAARSARPTPPRTPRPPRAFGSESTDTTFAVKQGQRLSVENFSGAVTVKTWLRDALHLEASHNRRTRIDIELSDSEVRLGTAGHMGPGAADMEIVIPSWMPVQIDGVNTDIEVLGSKSEIKAQTVHGDIDVEGGGNFLSLSSVDGAVKVVGARGRVQASSVNEGVQLSGVVGDITAESVNGDVVLLRPDSKSIEVSTINGGVLFDGLMRSGGVYTLSTHNGSIVMGLPENPDVSVSVSTFGGNFSTFLPILVSETRRHRPITFVLGKGGAQLELESFQGSIRLERLGAALEKAWLQTRGEDGAAEDLARKAIEMTHGKMKIMSREMKRAKVLMQRDGEAAPDSDGEKNPEEEER